MPGNAQGSLLADSREHTWCQRPNPRLIMCKASPLYYLSGSEAPLIFAWPNRSDSETSGMLG